MAFSVQDFQDLVRLLAEHPEWRMQLRPYILTEELLALPAIVQRLAEAQERTEGRLERLEAAVTALAEAQRRTEEQVRALAEAQQRSDRRLDRLEQHMAELRRSDRERRYRERASGYFGRLLRGVRVVADPELDRLLNEARDTGALDEDAIEDVRLAELIVGGQRPGEDDDTLLVVEVSVALDADDVERAARRAAALGRLRPTLAVVAGDRISDAAATLARARGVWQMVIGRPVEPGSAA